MKKYRRSNKQSYKKNKRNNKRKMTRNNKRKMRGGFGRGSGPIGYPWKSDDASTWPGVKGIDSESNHLSLSKYGVPAGPFDPPISTTDLAIKGGKRKTRKMCKRKTSKRKTSKRKIKKGGGLIPQDLVNLGRSFGFGIQNVASNFSSSKSTPVNPLPTESQGIDQSYKIIPTRVANVPKITKNSMKKVSKI